MDYANALNKIHSYDLSIEQNKQAIDISKTIEDDRMTGLSYAHLCDSLLIKGDYSESIESGEKAIAKFKKINMINYIAIACNWTAEPCCRVGLYSKMYERVVEAENLISGLDDFFREGKIEYFKSYYALSQNNESKALDHIDLSIEKFNFAKNTVQELQSCIEKVKILIEINKIDEASKMLGKAEHLFNQIKGNYENDTFTSIKIYIDIKNGATDRLVLDELLESLNKIKDYSVVEPYWYLARSYNYLDLNKLAQECHIRSKDIIENRSQIISNLEHQELFKNSIYNKKILSDLYDVKTEIKTDKIDLFAFCPSCGFKNENNFAFCPSCGNNLKQ